MTKSGWGTKELRPSLPQMRVWALLLAVLVVLCTMAGVAEAMPEPQRLPGLVARRTFGFRRVSNNRRRSRPTTTCTNQGLFVVCSWADTPPTATPPGCPSAAPLSAATVPAQDSVQCHRPAHGDRDAVIKAQWQIRSLHTPISLSLPSLPFPPCSLCFAIQSTDSSRSLSSSCPFPLPNWYSKHLSSPFAPFSLPNYYLSFIHLWNFPSIPFL